MISTKRTYGQKLLIAACMAAMLGVVCVFALDQILARTLYHFNETSWPHSWCVLGARQLGKPWGVIWLLYWWALISRQCHVVRTALLALALTMFFVLPLKHYVARVRPGVALVKIHPEDNVAPTDGRSFPSGDSATVFAVVGSVASVTSWPWTLVLFAGAVLVGFMRLVALAHYPSDVLVGAAIGLICACLALKGMARLPWKLTWLNASWAIYTGLILFPCLWLFEGWKPLCAFFTTCVPVVMILTLVTSRLKPDRIFRQALKAPDV